MLERLTRDPAIVEIVNRHDWQIGELCVASRSLRMWLTPSSTELHPHRDPTLLGLNRNAGESIALRLLTDSLEGVRSLNSVRRVLLHELAHIVHGPHELPFKVREPCLPRSRVLTPCRSWIALSPRALSTSTSGSGIPAIDSAAISAPSSTQRRTPRLPA